MQSAGQFIVQCRPVANNRDDNVYDAIVIVRVHPVHLVNPELRRVATDLWTKPISLTRWSACRQL